MASRVFPDVENSLIALADSMWDKSKYFANHGKRVSLMCSAVCDSLKIRSQDRKNIIAAGLLHDIGKIYTDEAVLHKSDKLTDVEWEQMKLHTVKGSALLRKFSSIDSDIITGVLYSHEHYDGTGYPLGLTGTNIPIAARIIHICDSIDSMAMGRAYKAPMKWEDIMQDLKDHSGTWYDEGIIKPCTNGLSRRLRLIILSNR